MAFLLLRSFDTFYSDSKKDIGGKGFGRFMFVKYFSEVRIESIYCEKDGNYNIRTFHFGRKNEIIINEDVKESKDKKHQTSIYLNNLFESATLDKEIETIARKLVEKLLIFFVNEDILCPKILVKDTYSNKEIFLNDYLKSDSAKN